MKGDVIPPDHHLALHCQPATGIEIDASGNPVGVNKEAFRVDGDGISTNWVEFNGGDFAAACLLLASCRVVRKKHRVGVLNVGEAIAAGQAADQVLRAVHDPVDGPPANPGHALLTGVEPTDDELLESLALIVNLRPFTDEAVLHSKAAFGR